MTHWQAFPPRYVFFVVVTLHVGRRNCHVIHAHAACKKIYMPPFLDGGLIAWTNASSFANSCMATSSERLMVVVVSISVCKWGVIPSQLPTNDGGICFTNHSPPMFQILRWWCFHIVCHTLCTGCQPSMISYAFPNLDHCNHMYCWNVQVWVEDNGSN